ncbi:MAG: GNAT family N-acetyltransferase [Deltaproteobacteria bacterium]|nr:GNAT family N-acetyltransferase [Deltaproteobacteria bacterium]
MSVHLRHHRSAASFLASASALLEATEAENNLLVGVALELNRDPSRHSNPNTLVTVHKPDGTCTAALLRTPPYGAVVTEAGPEDVAALVADLKSLLPSLHEVLAPRATAFAFASAWTAPWSGSPTVLLEMRVYRLEAVQSSDRAPPSGRLRLALHSDHPLLTRWVEAFHEEVGLPLHGAPTEVARRLVEDGATWLWDDAGRPVSLVCSQGETLRGVRISMVYTPPGDRGRGYASAAVSDTCRHVLASGKRMCLLFADEANATSNAIYKRLGFVEVARFAHVLLGSPAARRPGE